MYIEFQVDTNEAGIHRLLRRIADALENKTDERPIVLAPPGKRGPGRPRKYPFPPISAPVVQQEEPTEAAPPAEPAVVAIPANEPPTVEGPTPPIEARIYELKDCVEALTKFAQGAKGITRATELLRSIEIAPGVFAKRLGDVPASMYGQVMQLIEDASK
jgi:hypothetical protein